MNCIKCGMEIPDGARFCNFCGVKQDLTCTCCGAVLPNGARFCHMCGSPVQSEANPEPPFDPYADLDPYASLYEQKPAPKEEGSEEFEDPGEWEIDPDLDEFLEKLGERETSSELEETVDGESVEEDFFDESLFDELVEDESSDEETAAEQKPEPKEEAEQKPLPTVDGLSGRLSLDDLFGDLFSPKGPPPTATAYPNKQDFQKLFRTDGHGSRAYEDYSGKWKLKVQLRYNDTYCKDPNPDYHCYGSISIIEQKSGWAVTGLENLMAYTLSDRGIYYVTQEGKICFLDSDDKSTQVLGNQKNVISLNYEAGLLTVTYVTDRRQIEYNEHHDECGGYSEAWYDIYELNVGKVTIRHAPTGR